jgi:hypothetical protein
MSVSMDSNIVVLRAMGCTANSLTHFRVEVARFCSAWKFESSDVKYMRFMHT